MRSEKRSYVAVLPNGQEFFATDDARNSKAVTEDAVRRIYEGTTSRTNPQYLDVELFVLEIANGQQTRRKIATHKVLPPYASMTSEEFNEIQDELLNELPDEFQSYVTQTAWERGHSSGYEEVLGYVRDLVVDLAPVVQKYRTRILAEAS